MYPENSGSDNLVFNSPGFPHATITLPSGKTITINAPGASPTDFYVQNPEAQRQAVQQALRAVLDARRTARRSTGRSARSRPPGAPPPKDAPPSYSAGTEPAVGFVPVHAGEVAPGRQHHSAARRAERDRLRADRARRRRRHRRPRGLRPTARRSSCAPIGRGTMLTVTVAGRREHEQTFYTRADLAVGSGQSLPRSPHRAGRPAGQPAPRLQQHGDLRRHQRQRRELRRRRLSYSAEALAAQGVSAGSTVTAGDITLHLAAVAAGPARQRDRRRPAGRRSTLPAGTQQLGFLGSATNGPSQGLTTLTYSDGTTARYWLGLQRLDAQRRSGQAVVRQHDRGDHDLPQLQPLLGRPRQVDTHMFYASLPVDPTKTLRA